MSDWGLLELVDRDGNNLTDWETEFVDSLFTALKKYKSLTVTQRKKLEQIHEERCPSAR